LPVSGCAVVAAELYWTLIYCLRPVSEKRRNMTEFSSQSADACVIGTGASAATIFEALRKRLRRVHDTPVAHVNDRFRELMRDAFT